LNLQETGLLLAKIALLENRTATNETIMAWQEILEFTTFADGNEALIRHYRQSTEAVKPAHIVRLAKEIKEDRKKKHFDEFTTE
jgi:hypothetical protein